MKKLLLVKPPDHFMAQDEIRVWSTKIMRQNKMFIDYYIRLSIEDQEKLKEAVYDLIEDAISEMIPLIPEEVNYFLTLHNANEKGIIYSPIPPEAETKLRRML